MTRRRYTVVLADGVPDELTESWVKAEPAARRRLTYASDLAEQTLARRPRDCGTPSPVEPGIWIWTMTGSAAGATVFYEIIEDDCLVRILRFVFIP